MHETLAYEDQGQCMTAVVGAPRWYAWLETATAFSFEGEMGMLTAHKKHTPWSCSFHWGQQ
jgi:hypothetical protein